MMLSGEAWKRVPDRVASALRLISPDRVTSALHAISDVISLFRVEVSLKYEDLTVDRMTLTTATAGELSGKGFSVYNPAIFLPDPPNECSIIRSSLAKLYQSRDEVREVQAKIRAELKQAGKTVADRNRGDHSHARKSSSFQDWLEHANIRLTAVDESFSHFDAALTEANIKSEAMLTNILRAERILASAKDAYWLWLKIPAMSGGSQTRKSMWGLRQRLLFSGGVIAEFILFDASGKIQAAGVIPGYTGFIRLADSRERTTGNLANVDVAAVRPER